MSDSSIESGLADLESSDGGAAATVAAAAAAVKTPTTKARQSKTRVAAAAAAADNRQKNRSKRTMRPPRPRVTTTIEGFVIAIDQVVDLHTGAVVHPVQRSSAAGDSVSTMGSRHTMGQHLEKYEAAKKSAPSRRPGRPSHKKAAELARQEKRARRGAYMHTSYEHCLRLLEQPASQLLDACLGGAVATDRHSAWDRLHAAMCRGDAEGSGADGGGGGDDNAAADTNTFAHLAARNGSRYKIVYSLAQRIATAVDASGGVAAVREDKVTMCDFVDDLPEIGDYVVLGCTTSLNSKGRRVYKVCERGVRRGEVADLDVSLLRCVCNYVMDAAMAQMFTDKARVSLRSVGADATATFLLCDRRIGLGAVHGFNTLFVRSRYLQRKFVAELSPFFSIAARGTLQTLDGAALLHLLRIVWDSPVKLCFEWTFAPMLAARGEFSSDDDDDDDDANAGSDGADSTRWHSSRLVLSSGEYVRLMRETHRVADARDVEAVEFCQGRLRRLLRSPGAQCSGIEHALLVDADRERECERAIERLVHLGALVRSKDAQRLYWTSGELARRKALHDGLSRITDAADGHGTDVDGGSADTAVYSCHQHNLLDTLRYGDSDDKPGGIYIVDGARGSGKTWFARNYRDERVRAGHAPCIAVQAGSVASGGLYSADHTLATLRRTRRATAAVGDRIRAHLEAGPGSGGGGTSAARSAAAQSRRRCARLEPREKLRVLTDDDDAARCRERTVGDIVLAHFASTRADTAESHLAALIELSFRCKLDRSAVRDFALACVLHAAPVLVVDRAERIGDDALAALLGALPAVRTLVLLGCRAAAAPTNSVRAFAQLVHVAGTSRGAKSRRRRRVHAVCWDDACVQSVARLQACDPATPTDSGDAAAAARPRIAMERAVEAVARGELPVLRAHTIGELCDPASTGGAVIGVLDTTGAGGGLSASVPPPKTMDEMTSVHRHGDSGARDALVVRALEHNVVVHGDVQGVGTGVCVVAVSNYARHHYNTVCHEWRMRRAVAYVRSARGGGGCAAASSASGVTGGGSTSDDDDDDDVCIMGAGAASGVFATHAEFVRTEFERAASWARLGDRWVSANARPADDDSDDGGGGDDSYRYMPLFRGDAVCFEKTHAGNRAHACPLPSDAVRAGLCGTIEFVVEYITDDDVRAETQHASPAPIDKLVFHESTAQAVDRRNAFIVLRGCGTAVCLGEYARRDISHAYALTMRAAQRRIGGAHCATALVVTAGAPAAALDSETLAAAVALASHRAAFIDDGSTLPGVLRTGSHKERAHAYRGMAPALYKCTHALTHILVALGCKK